ncbi:competence protein [Staphylococcus equorum]|uniref:competence type IV pilus minor pilin ComGF n=1 Tax=Staphylococcus TaxID=1279 RepID=UPI000853D51C|nr:competence type IV pilus minor pilin ComGF [Staphylococcus equorum]MDG0822189.1 competence protein [Staphylococcus equorum]MDG0838111.1 competence protein [Staphylococcus equorum]MDK9870928.1 competence type IV pilus minor pilin ComGF [Staphylococcus equorum]MDK9876326.1 competence type IV pilus minor pilin ComGF [Staphylococcus equorum]MDN5829364.1 competence protein [Staphylococcus equorum]
MKFAIIKKISAFTYIEMLFALMITVLLLTIIPGIFKSTTALGFLANDHLNIESEFFARDLTQDLMNKKANIIIDKSKETQLLIKEENKLISYNFKNNKIIKSINGKGNITILNNVKAIKFRILKNKSLLVNLKIFDKDKTFEKQILF